MSQSLFYWNPFCNIDIEKIQSLEDMSQSLFYWNPFCNGSAGNCITEA